VPRFALRHPLVAIALGLLSAGSVQAQVDSLTMVLDPAAGIGTKPLAGYGYDPANDAIYVTTFGSSPTAPNNGAVVRFDDIATGGSSFTTMVTAAELQLYYRDGDPDRGVSTPSQSGFLLNPLPVGDQPAYSFAVITDLGRTREPASNATDPAATKRVYTYSLDQVPVGGDGRDVFTTRVTLADMQAVAGSTSTSSNNGRQFAWSGDGQSIYFVDSSSSYGGLWKVGALSGPAARILADADMELAEPAVRTAGGVDTIYFGGSESQFSANPGGIDMVTFDGTTVSARQTVVAATAIQDFHETTATPRIVAIATDEAGNLYYTNTTNASSREGTPTQRGIYRVDPEGRISKVIGYSERIAVFGDRDSTPNPNAFRIQPRTVSYAGSEDDFDVVQLLYAEPTGVNAVAGAYAFLPGDFNRDNTLDVDDVAMFAPQVTLRGVVKTDPAELKYDFNANDVVDWKDVEIFQQFLEYEPAGTPDPTLRIAADADFNGVVDFADFRTMRDAMGQSSQTFLAGDFDGNDRVDFADVQLLDRSYGATSTVIGGGVTPVPFDQAEWDAFVATMQIDLDVAADTAAQEAIGYPLITVAGSVTKTGGGTLVFDRTNPYAAPTTVEAGTLALAATGAVAGSDVAVAAGATLAVAEGVAAEVASLDLDTAGRVDLGSGRLEIAAGAVPADLRAAIVAARNGGGWDGGAGIGSADAAAAPGSRGVGYLLGDDGSATVAFAAPGDTNLDGAVDTFDLVAIDAAGRYGNGQAAAWEEGDFNYDGLVNAFDLVAIDTAAVFQQGSYLPGSGGPAAVTAVPEPGLPAGLAAAAAAVLAARRRLVRPRG
jgi:autotransporter-associated beta strand protein